MPRGEKPPPMAIREKGLWDAAVFRTGEAAWPAAPSGAELSATRLEEKLGDWARVRAGAANRTRERQRAFGFIMMGSRFRQLVPGDQGNFPFTVHFDWGLRCSRSANERGAASGKKAFVLVAYYGKSSAKL
jgi:hypothetical protein